jgi:hypothetical protein
MARPQAPFQTWTSGLESAFGWAWFSAPNVVIHQISVEKGTAAAAHAMSDQIEQLLTRHHEQAKSAGGAVVIADWRTIKGATPDARQAFIERMRARPPHLWRESVVVIQSTSPVLRLTAQSVDMMMAVAGRPRVQISNDIDAVLRKYYVTRPKSERPPARAAAR